MHCSENNSGEWIYILVIPSTEEGRREFYIVHEDYVNTSISAYEMAKTAYAVAEKFNFEFVWYKDKAARSELWSYEAVGNMDEDEYVSADDFFIFDTDF